MLSSKVVGLPAVSARWNYWAFSRRASRATSDLQRWYWGGTSTASLPRIDRLMRQSVSFVDSGAAKPRSIRGFRVVARATTGPRPASILTGLGLLAFAPRGVGVRRSLVQTFIDGAEDELGTAPTTQHLLGFTAARIPALLTGMSRYELEIVPAARHFVDGVAQPEDSAAGPVDGDPSLGPGAPETWSEIFVPREVEWDTGTVRRSEADALASIPVLEAMVRQAPESTLRYAESRGVAADLARVIDRMSLAPAGSGAQRLLETWPSEAVGQGPEATDRGDATSSASRLMQIRRLPGCDLTCDDLAAAETGPLVVLRDVTVRHGFVVTTEDEVVVLDDTADPRRKAVAGQHQLVVSASVDAQCALVSVEAASSERIERGILLAGRVDSNWYHFLVDTLPRLRFAETLPSTLPLLVNGATPATGIDLLRRLTGREIVRMDPSVAYEVGELWLVVGRSSVIDDMQSAADRRPRFHATSLRWLQSRIAELDPSSSAPTGTVVVERRAGVRAILGSRLLRVIPELRDATRLDPATASLDEQMRVYGSYARIVVPGGAAMANMLFMRAGTAVFGLVGDIRPRWVLWEELATVLGREYVQIPLPLVPVVGALLPDHHRSVVLTPRSALRLRQALAGRAS